MQQNELTRSHAGAATTLLQYPLCVNWIKPLLVLVVTTAGLCTVLSGCSTTHAKRLVAPRSAFYANDLVNAKQSLARLTEKPKTDASVVELDLALVELFEGNLSSAEQRLRSIRDTWEHYEQESLSENATSYLLDDQVRSYAGEDYEKILVRVFLTFCSLLGDGVDAESYSLQTLEKQKELAGHAQERWDEGLDEDNYCIPAVAPYLRGVLQESRFTEYRDAGRQFQRAASLVPDCLFLQEDIERCTTGVHSAPGHGVVHVIALVGQGPYKIEKTQPASQAALRIADVIVSSTGKHSVPPTLAPVKVPHITCPPKPFDLIGVAVNGVETSTTLPISDLHRLAESSFAAKQPEIVARSIARRVIKKGAIYAAKDELDVNSQLASLAMDAMGVVWEAAESADTRCWGLLPREIQVLRLELPEGEHNLRLEPVTAGTPVSEGKSVKVRVVNGRKHLLPFPIGPACSPWVKFSLANDRDPGLRNHT